MIKGFVITDYKVQGASFQLGIFDLYRNFKLRYKGLYKRFYSSYIQLSYLQILNVV